MDTWTYHNIYSAFVSVDHDEIASECNEYKQWATRINKICCSCALTSYAHNRMVIDFMLFVGLK